ncbi:LysM peptidoglycan-binding domain-containing protein [Flavobacteriaceae bacterium Ap0902]|nr:LysM peptidoglycan-binding domain-containing protein [Flavobacteriaceae bacterium Ap0902]
MKKLIFAGALLLSTFAFAQVGQHTVQPKETIYGISKEYNISQEELIEANPFLNDRILKVGDVLNIPGKTPSQTQTLENPNVANYEDGSYRYINIEPKETLYSLSKRYNISQEQIKSLNPFIEERGLQIGDIIRIPKQGSDPSRPQATQAVPEGMHLVQAGETVYSIAKRYGVEMSDIYAANRSVQTEGLKRDTYIKIPSKQTVPTQVTPTTQSFEHKVERKETVYSLLRKYDITLEELIAANPQLENGLQAGMILQIPVAEGAQLESAPRAVELTDDNFRDNQINIALIMPFFLDDMSKNAGERQIAQDFYIGTQVALKELIKKGKKINLEIIDSKNDKQELNKFLESSRMNDVDAIVGPFFQDLVVHTAEKLNNTNIPIFSPVVSSNTLAQYGNIYMATPKNEFAADIIIDEMAKSYNGKQEVKILTTDRDMEIANYVKAKFLKRFNGANVVITKNPTDLKLVEHTSYYKDGEGKTVEDITYEPILAVLASDNNSLGNQFVSTITKQDPASIDGFSLFFVPALDVFSTSNVDNINALKEIGFTYTATRMVNTFGENEKGILKTFKDEYCSVPNKNMSLGYDVVYDVIDRMNNSGKISEFDARRAETRLSSKFSYTDTENGKAKINKELRVIRLKK